VTGSWTLLSTIRLVSGRCEGSTRLGVGIVGYGRFGRFLHAALRDQVVAVCDRVPREALDLSARTYTDPTALFVDPDVAIVWVSTEPAAHAGLAVQALEAGMHVVVEKPLALTMEDARRVVDAAAATGLLVTVDHVLRHQVLVRAVEAIGDEGQLGSLRTFAVSNYANVDAVPPDHWFWDEGRSGGILVEHGVHFFDLAGQFARSPVERLVAFRQVRPDGRTDGVAATVVHGNGVIAHHTHVFCRSAEAERTTIDLGFERGSVTLTGWIPLQGEVWADPGLETLKRLEALLPAYRLIGDKAFPAVRARFSLNESKQAVYGTALRALLGNLEAAAAGRESLLVPLQEAASALETALLATEAASVDLTG
jgi:predicted dehydrogenase